MKLEDWNAFVKCVVDHYVGRMEMCSDLTELKKIKKEYDRFLADCNKALHKKD